MIEMASQITSLAIVYSIVYSDADQRKHQSSASLAFVRRIHRGPVNSPHKWPVTRKMFPFADVIMNQNTTIYFRKLKLKMSTKYRLFCLGSNVLICNFCIFKNVYLKWHPCQIGIMLFIQVHTMYITMFVNNHFANYPHLPLMLKSPKYHHICYSISRWVVCSHSK